MSFRNKGNLHAVILLEHQCHEIPSQEQISTSRSFSQYFLLCYRESLLN